jgi:urease accessory protein
MRATARVVAARGPDGVTRLPVLRSQSPLLLRRTGPVGEDAEVHLVGGAAGPLGGDRLRLEVEVGPGAGLCLRTAAASVALPGHDGDWSRVEVAATVAPGGRLAWLPEPLVAAHGCRHQADSRVTLADGGRLTWRDELVCGRHGEACGDAVVTLAVAYGGRPLYRHQLAVGPQAPGWDGPAVLGGARATGALLRVDPDWADGPPDPMLLGPTAALLPLAGPAVLATATGPDAATVRRHLDTAHRCAGVGRSAPGTNTLGS